MIRGDGGDGSDGSDGSGLYDPEKEDFIFTDPSEVFDRVEKYFDTTFNTDNKAEEEFLSLLSVTSNVFTIYVTVRTTDKVIGAHLSRRGLGATWGTGDSGDEGAIGESTSGTGCEIVTLVPLELYTHPVPYRPDELEALEDMEY